jgi:hypothetical protein
MPLQNRVDPYGALFRSPARGTMMGNRGGALHNEEREIVRPFLGRRWITCVLEFKDRRRTVMTPRRYTELFFLDEAVSFAAGHRPCAECRRERFNAFKNAWRRRDQTNPKKLLLAPEIDAELHRTRVDDEKRKVTYQAELGSLPNGCFVQIDKAAYLVWDQSLLRWTPERYSSQDRRPDRMKVTVLTPQPVVECFLVGYVPEIHASSGKSWTDTPKRVSL